MSIQFSHGELLNLIKSTSITIIVYRTYTAISQVPKKKKHNQEHLNPPQALTESIDINYTSKQLHKKIKKNKKN